MSSFKRNIKEKYSEQVQPKFTEDAWTQFLEYEQENNPDRKKGFWILLLTMTIAGVIVLFINMYNTEQVKDQENVVSEKVETSQDLEKENLMTLNNYQHVDDNRAVKSEKNQNHSDQILNNNKVLDSRTYNKVIDRWNAGVSSEYNEDIEKPLLDYISLYDESINLNSDPEGTEIYNNEKISKHLKRIADMPALAGIDFNTLLSPERKVESQSKPSILFEEEISVPSQYSIDVALLSSPVSHRSISRQRWLGGLLQGGYQISDDWSLVIGLDVSRLEFNSKVLNRSLGLRSVNYPDREASFQDVNRYSWMVGSSVRLSYKTLSYRNFQLLTNAGIGYQKEISRLLDYSFTRNEDLSVIQSSNDEPLNSSQFFWRIGLSTKWIIGNGTYIHSGVERQFSINSSPDILSPSFRFSIGLGKNF